jgi:hypothetical protein
MTPAARGLLDTSVFIALESDRPLNAGMLPDQSVICPVTIAELQAGVLISADVDIRARRLATLESTADIEVLAIDAEVAAVRRACGCISPRPAGGVEAESGRTVRQPAARRAAYAAAVT